MLSEKHKKSKLNSTIKKEEQEKGVIKQEGK